MLLLLCPRCSSILLLESLSCPACGREVAFEPAALTMRAVDDDGSVPGDDSLSCCANRVWGCNWLVPQEAESARCVACRLIRRRPDADDTLAMEKLAAASQVERRLLVQLAELRLPVEPWFRTEGGLAFDLLSSRSGQGPVTIGHAGGVVTIDLAETLDDHREALRVRLGEAYRTMLGHFRHEIGHYYEWKLVEQGPLIEEARALFGDERQSYADALARHYRYGSPDNWEETFISEYATMHPWEDFAECFAHYLHISDVMSTAAVGGMTLRPEPIAGRQDAAVVPRASYPEDGFDDMMDDWHWVSLLFNRVNRAMGKDDLYPFDIVEPVRRKLAFVHRVVRGSASGTAVPVLS